jgi:hypothetical protein
VELFSFLESLLESLYEVVHRWIRQSRLVHYAEFHGCSFCPEDPDNSISFSGDIFSKNPSKEYKFSNAANIIQGSAHGLRFTYFEKTLIEDGGDFEKKPVATHSIIAIDSSASEHFESGEAVDKDLTFYRENGGICFWWRGTGSSSEKAIPVKRLEQWLADIASTFKTGVAKAALP